MEDRRRKKRVIEEIVSKACAERMEDYNETPFLHYIGAKKGLGPNVDFFPIEEIKISLQEFYDVEIPSNKLPLDQSRVSFRENADKIGINIGKDGGAAHQVTSLNNDDSRTASNAGEEPKKSSLVDDEEEKVMQARFEHNLNKV